MKVINRKARIIDEKTIIIKKGAIVATLLVS